VTSKTVDKGRNGGKDTKESSEHNHFVPVLKLISEGHRDESNARDEVTNVKKEETSEERICRSEHSGGFLVAPDSPEGGAEVT